MELVSADVRSITSPRLAVKYSALCLIVHMGRGAEMSALYYDPNEAVQEDDNYLFNLHLKHQEDLIIISQETEDEAQRSE